MFFRTYDSMFDYQYTGVLDAVKMRLDRERAIELRKKGKTYGEISGTLGVPKSTLSGWLAGISLPKDIEEELAAKARRAWAKNITTYNKTRAVIARKKAAEAQEASAASIGKLTKRELQLIGASLYWAEGSKRDRWKTVFSNSDPSLIRLIMRFFREVCEVSEGHFNLRIHIHQNISEDDAKRYWSRLTKIPLNQFQKTQTVVSKSSRGRRKVNTLPHGTLHIMVHDVSVVNRIKGWIQGISQA